MTQSLSSTPWLTLALEKSQMFSGKQLEKAEAVGSFPDSEPVSGPWPDSAGMWQGPHGGGRLWDSAERSPAPRLSLRSIQKWHQ